MKKRFIKSGSIVMACILMAGMGLNGCKPKEDAPDLPPVASMRLDATAFGGSNKVVDTTGNWGYSALNVLVWNTVLYVNLAVPTAAFGEAFNHEPKYDRKDEHWVWSYSAWWGGAKYDCALHGWIADSKSNWEMHISKSGGFQDVIWFSGTSELDNSGGSWVLNKDGDNPVSYISVNWSRTGTDDVDITFTNILSTDPNVGDYIHAGHTTTNPLYDRFYTIHHEVDANDTEIEWHHLNALGRVKDPKFFGDSNYHCWDNALVDCVCP